MKYANIPGIKYTTSAIETLPNWKNNSENQRSANDRHFPPVHSDYNDKAQ